MKELKLKLINLLSIVFLVIYVFGFVFILYKIINFFNEVTIPPQEIKNLQSYDLEYKKFLK